MPHHAALAVALVACFCPAFARAGRPAEPPDVTFASLLAEMTDRAALAQLPEPAYTCRQLSSYDPASTAPGDESWFANGDAGHFLRTDQIGGRTEYVLMDATGPGAIVRLWSANPKGTLRIYLDGADGDAPTIEAPMADFLGGTGMVPPPLSALCSRGYNLYLPIPYAKRCLVTADEPGFYYQVNYRTYEHGTTVEPFAPDTLATQRDAIAAACRTLTAGASDVAAAPGQLDYFLSLKPGMDAAAARLSPRADDGVGMAVVGLTLQVHDAGASAAEIERALRSVILTGSFDGEHTIWCPVGDFFGSGVGLNPFTGFFRAVTATDGDAPANNSGVAASGGGKEGRLTSRWVMPYQRDARIGLHNLAGGGLPVEMDLLIDTEPVDFTDRSMHFFARWRDVYPIHTRAGAGTMDFNYVTVQAGSGGGAGAGGGGVYVGDTLAVMNPVADWWGEGDEKITVDGEPFPSHFGTGTEDYYGYAWCNPEPFSAPFHAQTRSDGAALGNNWGHTTVTRTRALDAIPFTTSLQMDMEVWHWKEADVAYAATTYFYARPGATHNRPPQPDRAAAPIPQPPPLPPPPPPFKIPGAIEAESLDITSRSDGLVAGPQGGFAPGVWSGEAHLWVRARRPGDFVELRIPAPDEARHDVLVRLTRSFDYGVVALAINGTPAGDGAAPNGKGIDTFNTDAHWVDTIGPVDLGAHAPITGADGEPFYTLRIEVTGANERSEGARYFFGIDCILLEPPAGPPASSRPAAGQTSD